MTPTVAERSWEIRQGDCIEVMRDMEAESVHCYAIGIELSPEYVRLAERRLAVVRPVPSAELSGAL